MSATAYSPALLKEYKLSMPSDMKNIHFKVPRPLYEEFKTAFPEVGLMKILFTQFMQMAIEGAEEKDSFVRGIYKECVERAEDDREMLPFEEGY